MSRVCQITGKKALVGNRVSHSNHKTKRRLEVNLRNKRFWFEEEGRWIRLRLSARAMRLIDKQGLAEVVRQLRARGEKILIRPAAAETQRSRLVCAGAALLVACGGAGAGRGGQPGAEADWVLVVAGDGGARVRAVAALPGGGAAAVGRFDGELAAGSAELASAGAGDGFAIRISPAGQVVWCVGLLGEGDEELTAVAPAADGGIAVAGASSGIAALGGRRIATPGQPGAIVARLGPDGAPIWQRPIGATGYAVPAALAWTADRDLVVAGYFAGTLDPDGAALHGAGSLDLWVARLAGADGRVEWMHRAGGPGADAAHAIAVAGDGAVVVAGSFHRWADFSGTTLRSADEDADPFLAAVGRDGFAWARSLPTEGAGVAQAVAAAPGARLAVAVTFAGFVQLESGRIAAEREAGGGLVALFGSTGDEVWARRLDTSSSADGVAAASGALLVTGASSGKKGYVAAVSAAGRPLWSRAIGGDAGQAQPVALAASGDAALVAGSASERLIIGSFAADVAGESDGFVARLRAPR